MNVTGEHGKWLPILWVAGGMVSHGLRKAFPGPMERDLFGDIGDEWTLTHDPESPPETEWLLDDSVLFRRSANDPSSYAPAVSEVQILAASWQREGESEWSDWHGAGGRILRYRNQRFQETDRLFLELFNFDHEELEERLKAKEKYRKIDEIPFDFVRRRMSVVVEDETGLNTLICKGAVDEVLSLCTRVEINGEVIDVQPAHDAQRRQAQRQVNAPEECKWIAAIDIGGVIIVAWDREKKLAQ